MKLLRLLGLASLGLTLTFGVARAETKVELKGVHICCGACTRAIGDILKKVDGVTAKADQKGKTVSITAPDAATAQKAVDALAEAGFHGDTGSKEVTIKDDSGATKGKVKTLSLTGIHNCCNACARSIKETLKKVDGVTGDTAKAKVSDFEVTGDFDALEVIKALNAAGLHVKVKK